MYVLEQEYYPCRDLVQKTLRSSSFLDVRDFCSTAVINMIDICLSLAVRSGDVDWKTLGNILVAQALGDVCSNL